MGLLSYEQTATAAGRSTNASVDTTLVNLGDLFADGLNVALIVFAAMGFFLIAYALWSSHQHTSTNGQSGFGPGKASTTAIIGVLLTMIPTLAFLMRNSLLS